MVFIIIDIGIVIIAVITVTTVVGVMVKAILMMVVIKLFFIFTSIVIIIIIVDIVACLVFILWSLMLFELAGNGSALMHAALFAKLNLFCLISLLVASFSPVLWNLRGWCLEVGGLTGGRVGVRCSTCDGQNPFVAGVISSDDSMHFPG